MDHKDDEAGDKGIAASPRSPEARFGMLCFLSQLGLIASAASAEQREAVSNPPVDLPVIRLGKKDE